MSPTIGSSTTKTYPAEHASKRAWAGRFWQVPRCFVGLVLMVMIGTLFGQTTLIGPDIGSRLTLVPLANMVLAGLLSPLFVRLIDRDTGLFRFT